jgi:octaprenyl-diphosphate synthase
MDTSTATKPHDRLAATLDREMAAVNDLIRARMVSEHAPRIPEVTAHLVEAGGKRLRPMLTLAAARLCGYSGDHHIRLAATVEFIHTATLLHDDVVDESGQRRGRPTANLLWDNKSSVLVGDYLFARSFQLMVETGSLKVLDILANAAATIAEGEVLQMTAASDLRTDEGIYLKVVRGKTAALFSAATQAGGVIAGASDAQVQALFDYGDALGIAFQIADDLLDYQGDARATGKNVGDDFRERKLTLPVIKAIAQARRTCLLDPHHRTGPPAGRRSGSGAGIDGQIRHTGGHPRRCRRLGRTGPRCAGGAARRSHPRHAARSCRLCGCPADLICPGALDLARRIGRDARIS